MTKPLLHNLHRVFSGPLYGRWRVRDWHLLSAPALGVMIFALVSTAQVGLSSSARAQDRSVPSGSGLPVPRFVSLKSDRVNLRNGPSTEYPTGWVFRRAGLPLEVIKEYEAWRQVRDAEGTTGWVLQSLLSGRRTALVLPWEIKAGLKPPQVAIHSRDSERSSVVVNVEAGVIANLHSCDGRWCRVSVEDYGGYIEQKKLWGVYEGETIN
ncbi:MAG: SH3 domain-containing protein [Hyphomicrobiaceae bacterium]